LYSIDELGEVNDEKRMVWYGFSEYTYFQLGNVRQWLNFLTNNHATVSKIFKAKCFLKGDFLGASSEHNPSYVWRGI
jgi:hypothetical protein